MMPQFIAVQCFKCNHYQVSHKRKDAKFNCKLCNAKQSVRKVFAHSDRGADVRKFIQQLNLARGRAEEQFDQLCPDNAAEQHHDENHSSNSSDKSPDVTLERVPLGQSRWQPYSSAVARTIRASNPDELDDVDGEDDLVTTLPDMQGKARGRRRKRASRKRQGSGENIERNLKVGVAPIRKNLSEKNENVRSANQGWHQWGAAPVRKQPQATEASSQEVCKTPVRRTYQWGSAMPRTNESPPRANSHSHNQRNRWGVPGSLPPQTPPQSNPRLSQGVTTTLDADTMFTTLGGDEEVHEEVVY